MVGIVVNLVVTWLKSDFLSEFLSCNLITVLIALVAINTTTTSVVLTKVREIADQLGGHFERTAAEMKLSITEQLVLIVVAIMVQVLGASKVLVAWLPSVRFVTDVLLVAILAYAIYILRDTASSVFVILQFENEQGGGTQK